MKVLSVFVAVCLLTAADAGAYLDPSTMQLGVFQYVVSGLVAVILYCVSKMKAIKKFTAKLIRSKENPCGKP